MPTGGIPTGTFAKAEEHPSALNGGTKTTVVPPSAIHSQRVGPVTPGPLEFPSSGGNSNSLSNSSGSSSKNSDRFVAAKTAVHDKNPHSEHVSTSTSTSSSSPAPSAPAPTSSGNVVSLGSVSAPIPVGGMLYRGSMMRLSTGYKKKFKPTFTLFTDTTLSFFSSESMKKLEFSFPVKISSAIVGPRNNFCLTVTCGEDQLLLKTESVDLVKMLVILINGLLIDLLID